MDSPATRSSGSSAGFLDYVAVAIWMGSLPFAVGLIIIGLIGLPSTWAFALLLALGTLAVIPIYEDSWLARNVSRLGILSLSRGGVLRNLNADQAPSLMGPQRERASQCA